MGYTFTYIIGKSSPASETFDSNFWDLRGRQPEIENMGSSLTLTVPPTEVTLIEEECRD